MYPLYPKFSCKFRDLYLISMECTHYTLSFLVNSMIYTPIVGNILSLVIKLINYNKLGKIQEIPNIIPKCYIIHKYLYPNSESLC